METNKIDYIYLDSMLKEDEISFREQLKSFVDQSILPVFENTLPDINSVKNIIYELGRNKLIGSFINGYDCPGYSALKQGLICQEIERADGGLRSFLTTQGSLVMFAIWKFGSDIQKKKYLQKMGKCEIIGAFGLTEEDANGNPAQMKTFAYKDGGKWIVTGKKMWITNAPIADIAIIWAKTDNGIKAFILEMDSKGVTLVHNKVHTSLRGLITSAIELNDVIIPEKNILPNVDGLKSALICLSEKRYGVAWGALGAATDCYTESMNYAKERIIFGKPLVSSQLVQKKLVNMLIELTKSKAVTIQVARIKDKGKDFRHEMVSFIALNNLTKSVEIAREAKDIHGINGISTKSRVIRHLLNLESLDGYEGTNDLYTLIVGRDITGMQAFF